ncbi:MULTISPECIES: oxygen-insensitive NADPH nitroreductase [Bacillaceae]|uniref:oxygen-insensitive NADPH nitroreductase n=1 Tax=Shouchella oshimensis TaxID=290588 RepID=UPI000A4303A6|nr:oxygen-insensitive NADPH nitroreductase [Alkalicoccobacillus plakortidis]
MNEIIKGMSAHRSIRAYQSENVTKEQIQMITNAARWASTSNHVQAYSILSIQSKQTKQTLAELTGGQKWVEECPVFFVLCADYTRQRYASEKHGVSFDVGGAEQLLVAAVDVALVAQNMLLAAESINLGGVMIGGIRNQPKEVSELLGLPDYVFPVMGLAIGAPGQDIPQKPRLPEQAVVHEEVYNTSQQELIDTYDAEIEGYYLERTNGNRSSTWTELMAQYTSVRKRAHMDHYLKEKGFLQSEKGENEMNRFTGIGDIYCVGRNYAEHAKELGNDVPKQPLLFTKPRSSLALADGQQLAFPHNKGSIHYEIELVLKIDRDVNQEDKLVDVVSEVALGLDLTLREVQDTLKKKGHPWLRAKGFPNAAVLTPFFAFTGEEACQTIPFQLEKNGELVQEGYTSQMIFSLSALFEEVKREFGLRKGDLLFTGTPKGVGELKQGDHFSLYFNHEEKGSFTVSE